MFQIPSLADLTDRTRKAFRAYLPGSDAWLWPNNINPTAKVVAGTAKEVFGFADYIQKQKFAGTADSENLDLHGQEYGLSRRPAAPAVGAVTVTATDATAVAVGAVFRRADDVDYLATEAASIDGSGTFDVAVECVTAGKIGNAEAGASLDIVSGVTGPSPLAQVATDGITQGADVEPDGDDWTTDLGTFRGRILFRKRYPPHGGAAADYVQWASDVAGVTRVYVERLWAGAGTVRVFVLMDDLYPNGIAPPADIMRVDDYIETLRPAGAIVTVAAPTPKVVDVQIGGLSPDTVDMRETVLAELRAAFFRLSRVAGNDTPHDGMPFLATPTTFSRSWLWQAVANAAGEERHSINLPAADVTLNAGEIPVIGTVTFVP